MSTYKIISADDHVQETPRSLGEAASCQHATMPEFMAAK